MKITVYSKKEGFRRAGMAFGSEPVVLDTDDLTKEQLKSLKEEPQLIVVEGEAIAEPDKKGDKLKAENDTLKVAVADLQKQVSDKAAALASADDVLKAAQSEISALTDQIADLTSQLNAANDELAALKADTGSSSKKK